MAMDSDAIGNMESLRSAVWRRLDVRKFAIGKETVDRAVNFYVANWPIFGQQSGDIDEYQDMLVKMGSAVFNPGSALPGRKQKYGFVIWSMILSAVISQIVAALIKWWLESDANKIAMAEMREYRRRQG